MYSIGSMPGGRPFETLKAALDAWTPDSDNIWVDGVRELTIDEARYLLGHYPENMAETAKDESL